MAVLIRSRTERFPVAWAEQKAPASACGYRLGIFVSKKQFEHGMVNCRLSRVHGAGGLRQVKVRESRATIRSYAALRDAGYSIVNSCAASQPSTTFV